MDANAIADIRSEAIRRVTDVVDARGMTGQRDILELAAEVVGEIVRTVPAPPPIAVQRRILIEVGNTAFESRQKALRAAPEESKDPLDLLVEPEAASQRSAVIGTGQSRRVMQVKEDVMKLLMQRIDIAAASSMSAGALREQVDAEVEEIVDTLRLQLNSLEIRQLSASLLDDMIGLGPLEQLLADDSVTDIMVNGANQIYVERRGLLELTDVEFRDDAHVMHVATRIVSAIGRRVDEANPLVDARLKDGSRVNIIIPPLAIDGPMIAIRKFAKREITLDMMAQQLNMSLPMATVLKIAARSRLNILISGGTGSGKTTLLNAMSQMISHSERTITIEDAAELRLQQPHVVRLETRPPSIEGVGEITMRHLVKNALRMRPDRIILGEIRGEEAFDMLQAMNTGHDGSMCTIHANSPRDSLTRLENMVAMSGLKLPPEAVREQIAGAIQMVVQISRMHDGKRRITRISEVTGMESDVITMQDLFTFSPEGSDAMGHIKGEFECSKVQPAFRKRAEMFELGGRLMEAIRS